MINLTRGQVKLTDFAKKDIDNKIAIINDNNNNTFLHYDLPLKYESTLKWLENKDNSNRIDLTIRYNGEVCGFIGLLNIDKKNKKAEYYICIDYKFSGKGIGYLSSKLLLDYAFEKLNINKIYLFTEIDNKKAQHLFEKIGFKKEGLLKNDIIFNNKNVSRYAYGYYRENTN